MRGYARRGIRETRGRRSVARGESSGAVCEGEIKECFHYAKTLGAEFSVGSQMVKSFSVRSDRIRVADWERGLP